MDGSVSSCNDSRCIALVESNLRKQSIIKKTAEQSSNKITGQSQ